MFRIRPTGRHLATGMLRWTKMPCPVGPRIAIVGLLLIRISLLGLLPGAVALRDVRIEVPEAVRRGDRAKLTCEYDLEGSPLYSLKWYRGDEEFYRFVPKEAPPSKVFPQPGVNVDVSLSNARQVVLSDVQLELTGVYKCEVSADAPSFHTDIKAATMVVVVLPDDTPIVRTEKTRYSSGERIRANCTSPSSFPAANLTWFLNGKQVPASSTRHYPVIMVPHSQRTTVAPTTEGSIWRRDDSADDPSAALYSSLAASGGHYDGNGFSPVAATPTVPALETSVLGLELELDPEAYSFSTMMGSGSAEPSTAASSSSASSSPSSGVNGKHSHQPQTHQQQPPQPQQKYITLRCLATLFAFYRRATEVHLTADEPPPQIAPVLLGAGGDPGVDARYQSAGPQPGAAHAADTSSSGSRGPCLLQPSCVASSLLSLAPLLLLALSGAVRAPFGAR